MNMKTKRSLFTLFLTSFTMLTLLLVNSVLIMTTAIAN